jgi:hypothetical protein
MVGYSPRNTPKGAQVTVHGEPTASAGHRHEIGLFTTLAAPVHCRTGSPTAVEPPPVMSRRGRREDSIDARSLLSRTSSGAELPTVVWGAESGEHEGRVVGGRSLFSLEARTHGVPAHVEVERIPPRDSPRWLPSRWTG